MKLRLRMIKVDANIGVKSQCRLCSLGPSDQEHLLDCVFMKTKCTELLNMNEKYTDLYGNNVRKLNNLATIFQLVIRENEIFHEKLIT